MARNEFSTKAREPVNRGAGIRIENSRTRHRKFYLTRRQVFLILCMLMLFMGSGLSYVWSNFEKTRIGYDLSQLKEQEMRLVQENRKLRIILALEKSTPKLEAKAEKLGLKPAAPEQVVHLK